MHIAPSLHRLSEDEAIIERSALAGAAEASHVVKDLLSILGLGLAVGLSTAIALALTNVTNL